MKSFCGVGLTEVILLSGIFVSLMNSNEATYHQQNEDDYRKPTDQDLTRAFHPDDYAAIDLKRIQPQISTSQYDYYDYSNQDYPNYDHNKDDDESLKPNNDYENHDFDPKRENSGLGISGLEKSIPGTAGMDYPNFNRMPRTEFNCQDHPDAGLYGDIETDCQMFHICQEDGRHDTFLCPVGTIFNQKHFICDWWFNYNCSETPQFFSLNSMIYQNPPSSSQNKKRRHMHHGQRKNLFLEGLMKKMHFIMEDDKEIKTEVPDKFQENINNDTNTWNKAEDSTSKDEQSLKTDIWEPMRRYRRVKVRKITLRPTQGYPLPKHEYLTDERSPSVNKGDGFDRRIENHMTTINYAIQLLHKNLNSPSNMDSQFSSTSNVEYATASGLTSVDDGNHLNAFPDQHTITESTRLAINSQNTQYLPAITIPSELDPTLEFSTENYPAENITIFHTPGAFLSNQIGINKIEDNSFRNNLQNEDERLFTVVDNSVTPLSDLFSADKGISEEKLLDFDSKRRIPINIDENQTPVRRQSPEYKRNFRFRRPGMKRLRWRQRLTKQKEIKTEPETNFMPRNTTSIFKVKRFRKRKPSKPQRKVEWMFYPRNDTISSSWNDFVRKRRQMLMAKKILQTNERLVPSKSPPTSTFSIQNDDHYSSTVGIIASNDDNSYDFEKEEIIKKSFDENGNHISPIHEQTKDVQMMEKTKNANEEENTDEVKETREYTPENIEEGENLQRNRKLSKIRVNRRCKAVCIKLIKNRLSNLEDKDGLYTLGTNNLNLQWLNIRRLPNPSSITEYQPQAAESGSIISKESSCDENFKDSYRGWSIIIDRGTVTKEKTIKKKCRSKYNSKNGYEGNLSYNDQLLGNKDGKHMFSQRLQNHANFRQLWLQNFRRRGVHGTVTFPIDETLFSSESGASGRSEGGNSGHGITDYQREAYENYPDADSESHRPIIDWKEKLLQDEILKASSFNVGSQSQPSPSPSHKQKGSRRNRAPTRNSNSGWSRDFSKNSSPGIDALRMPTNIAPLAKIIWPPGARGSKIDWSQSTRDNPISPKFSSTNWFIEMRNPESALSNKSVTHDDFPSNISSASNDVNEELVSDFKAFLKSIFSKLSVGQIQPNTKNGSIISNDKHWVSNLTNSKQNKDLDSQTIHFIHVENRANHLSSSNTNTSLGDRFLKKQLTNDYSLNNNKQEKILASNNWRFLKHSDSPDIKYRNLRNGTSTHGQDFEDSWQLDYRNISEYQPQGDFSSHHVSGPWSLEEQLTDWSEDLPIEFSSNYNATQNSQSFNDQGIKDNWSSGGHNSRKNEYPNIQDSISTENPNNQKRHSENTENSKKNLSRNLDWPTYYTEDKGSSEVSQKGWQSNNNRQNWSSIMKNSRNAFSSIKQDSTDDDDDAFLGRQGNMKGWSTVDEDSQKRWMGDSSSQKGRGSADVHPLKDWLFGTENPQEMPSSDTRDQTKGWQGVNTGNGWSFDIQNPGLRDSNIQISDKGQSWDKKDDQEDNLRNNNKHFGNRMKSDFPATKGNRQQPSNRGQNKGGQNSSNSQNNWSPSGHNSQKRWQLDNANTRNDRSGNPQPTKGGLSGSSQQRPKTDKKQMQQNRSPSNSKGFHKDRSFDISKDDWSSKGSKDGWSSNGSKDDWSSNGSKDDWPSNISQDNWPSISSEDDWSSSVSKEEWPSNSRRSTKGSSVRSFNSKGSKTDWPSNSRQDAKGSLLGSFNSKESKTDWSLDHGVFKGDSSKVKDEWKLNSQNSKAQSQTPDTKDVNPNWPSTYKGSNGNKKPQSRYDNTQNTNMRKIYPMNSKGNPNIRMPKNQTIMKKIRWSVQIDGNGKPKSGWIPITLRPQLNIPTKSKDDEMLKDEDDDWSSWGNNPSHADNESKKHGNVDISKIIDTQASEHKLLWVSSINSPPQPLAENLKNFQQSYMHQSDIKQEWSVPFDGTTIPASGWLPIFNIKTAHFAKSKNQTKLIVPKNESKLNSDSEESKSAKNNNTENIPYKQLYNITNNNTFISTDIMPTKIEGNETNYRDHQKQVVNYSSEGTSSQFANILTVGTRNDSNNAEHLSHYTIITRGDINKHDAREKKILQTTRLSPIVSAELKSKFMQVGHNETLRILPFSLIHKQLYQASKDGLKATPFKTEILKSSILVKSSHNSSHQSNATEDKKPHQYTTFTAADGRMHSLKQHYPPPNLELSSFSNIFDGTKKLPFSTNYGVTKFSNRTRDSVDNKPKEVRTVGNVHKLQF